MGNNVPSLAGLWLGAAAQHAERKPNAAASLPTGT